MLQYPCRDAWVPLGTARRRTGQPRCTPYCCVR
uniref:Uncharacterized protein n=1 Tax=Arundo donax TaxID=35708 RepID=A0A0A8YNM5_ARUDO